MEPIRDNEKIDEKIKSLVLLLRENNVNTFASCQGGVGHVFELPTIRFFPNSWNESEERKRIVNILHDAGYYGYYIKSYHAYQNNTEEWKQEQYAFMEIELWNGSL